MRVHRSRFRCRDRHRVLSPHLRGDSSHKHGSAGLCAGGSGSVVHLSIGGRFVRLRSGGHLRDDLHVLPVGEEREHGLAVRLCVLCVELFLHGGVVGRLRVHHQHHSHLRGSDGSNPCKPPFLVTTRPLFTPPVHRVHDVLHSGLDPGDADPLRGLQRGQTGRVHHFARRVHRSAVYPFFSPL